MSDKELRKQLIRVAHANPGYIRDQLLQLIRGGDGQVKTALSQDTVDFAEWALNQPPMSPAEVQNYVQGALKIKTLPPIKKRQGPRWQVGDRVRVKASSHKNPETAEVYLQYDGKIGTVVQASASKHDGGDIVVDLDGGPSGVVFPGAEAYRGVGLSTYNPPKVSKGSPMVEIIYKAGKKPTPDQVVQAQNYMAGGRPGETRIGQYYSGSVHKAAINAKGQYYFTALPQQRMTLDPAQFRSYDWRSFNPSIGKVFYIGIMGRRPSNWQRELEGMRAEAGTGVRAAASNPYYVTTGPMGMLELRQTRYRGKTRKPKNDVMAVARDINELTRMVKMLGPEAQQAVAEYR